MNFYKRKKFGTRLVQIAYHYWLKKQVEVPYMPYRLWIEPTNRCNLSCVMCPNKEFKKEELGFMDFKLFKKIVDEAQGWIYDINLHHRGEPTLHPRLIDMIDYAKELDFSVKLHTNGTTLTEKMAQNLIDVRLDLISFSFDGYASDVYEKIRGGAKFEETLSQIHRFLETKQMGGHNKPKTVMEVMELNQDADSLRAKPAFIQELKKRGLDRFIVKKPHNWAGNVDLKTGDSTSFTACTFPWHSLVVCWDGMTGPCPHDFFGKIVLGDMRSDTIASTFNSQASIRLREQMFQGTFEALDEPCKSCDSVRRKRFLGMPLASLKYVKE